MNEELINKVKEKLCERCEDKNKCKQKPHKLMKCSVFYLVSKN